MEPPAFPTLLIPLPAACLPPSAPPPRDTLSLSTVTAPLNIRWVWPAVAAPAGNDDIRFILWRPPVAKKTSTNSTDDRGHDQVTLNNLPSGKKKKLLSTPASLSSTTVAATYKGIIMRVISNHWRNTNILKKKKQKRQTRASSVKLGHAGDGSPGHNQLPRVRGSDSPLSVFAASLMVH